MNYFHLDVMMGDPGGYDREIEYIKELNKMKPNWYPLHIMNLVIEENKYRGETQSWLNKFDNLPPRRDKSSALFRYRKTTPLRRVPTYPSTPGRYLGLGPRQSIIFKN